MNYTLEIESKEKELQELKQKAAQLRINEATLKVGNCYKSKPSDSHTYDGYTRYHKLLYVDDSGFGYKLVIDEHLAFQKLRLFKGPEFGNNIKIPEQYVYLTISQAFNFESDLAYLEEITLEEYNKAKEKALALMANPQVPKDWAEAQSLHKESIKEGKTE